MNEIRKAVLSSLVLLLIVVAGDRLLSAVLRQTLMRSRFRFSAALRPGVDADVIVLGDSRGVTSMYVPEVERLTGRRTFSLAYNGMPTLVAEALLADYLEHNRAPRLAVIEVTSAVETRAFLSEIHTFGELSPRLEALYAAEHPTAARVGNVLTLLRFNSELFLRTLYYLRRSDQDWANWLAMAGDVPQSGAISPWALRPLPENLAAMERMIRLLQSRNCQVRLLIGPYLPEYAAHSNLTEFAALIAGHAHRVDPKLAVWNYSAAIAGPSHYTDVIHLNGSGAKQLAAVMQRDGFFAVHD
ncbi:MAG TPA: hypothetical protein VGQ46_18890 [Thermoanaerobaculia bacterium]|jgi:hypothetical protein|nr:hypothetical protein [Thermoanaerobaculia bacterium]